MATNFYLDTRADKSGDVAIRVSVSIGGARFVTSTMHKISPAKWSADKQRVKKGGTSAKGVPYNVINASLQAISGHFATYETNCLAQGIAISADTLKSEYNSNFSRKRATDTTSDKELSFFDCLDMFVSQESKQKNWTFRMVQKFNTLKRHLQSYDDALSFDALTEAKISGFMDFLRAERDMLNSTIAKQISLLKWFMRWATEKKHNTNGEFMTFAPKLKVSGKKVIFLEWAELMKVYNYEIPQNGTIVNLADANGTPYDKTMSDAKAIAKARDMFCFCCFTSLRYSDAANLKWSNISGTSMSLTTIKTADLITIELNKYALSILEKYKPQAATNGGFVFPSLTNQRMNIYLKALCELCGINQMVTQTHYKGTERIDETLPKYELIGTHAGRRTFICNALMLGIPAEIVMKWTGHSDYKAMKPYIAIADAAKAKAMELFNNI